jgi:hypothetical protein
MASWCWRCRGRYGDRLPRFQAGRRAVDAAGRAFSLGAGSCSLRSGFAGISSSPPLIFVPLPRKSERPGDLVEHPAYLGERNLGDVLVFDAQPLQQAATFSEILSRP